MLRKLAVALIAASVLTAPVLAQGTADTKTKTDAPAATAPAPKIVAAQPSLATSKVKAHKPLMRHVAYKHRKHIRFAHVKHRKHIKLVKVRHHAPAKIVKVKHLKPVKYVSHAKAKHGITYGIKHSVTARHTAKPVHHVTRKSTTYARSSSPAAHKSVN
jgi:hypothetical protein